MRRKRRYLIYLWIFVYTSQIGVCTFNYFSPKKSLEVHSSPIFPSRNFSAKKSFTFPVTFKFEDDSKKSLSRVSQRAKVRFPKHGLLEVRAIEEVNSLPRLEFINPKTEKLISKFEMGAHDPTYYEINRLCREQNPCSLLKVLNIKRLPTPLILGLGIHHGGSDNGYTVSLIGEVNGQLKALTSEPIETAIQGGIFVGDLGKGRGVGAASWCFIWGNSIDEGHYSSHRYEVEIFLFDKKTNLFKKTKTMRTKRTYGGRGEEALRELKLPIKDLIQTVPSLEYLRRYRETGF